MKLYPQDLRDRQHAVIVRRRAYGMYGPTTPDTYGALSSDPPPPRLGKLGRVWARDTGLTEQEAATGLPASSMQTGAALWFGPGFGIPLAVLAAIGATVSHALPGWEAWGGAVAVSGLITSLSMTTFPRAALRGLYRKPLTVSEIDALLPTAHNDIDHAYLGLLRDSILQAVPPDAEAGLRDALRALGRATDNLPPLTAPPQDTNALRQQAADTLARARQERDDVIAASLERQADALERRAAASDRSALVSQRAHALRAELLAQMDALRAGLTDFSTSGATDTVLLAALSENARRVADEATSVAQARTELDTFLVAPPESSVLQARQG